MIAFKAHVRIFDIDGKIMLYIACIQVYSTRCEKLLLSRIVIINIDSRESFFSSLTLTLARSSSW